LTRAGVQRVFATDVTAGVQGSFNITVNPAAAKTLQLAAPATVTRGVAFNLTVTALDQFGNRATGYNGTVKFSSTDPVAGLPANYSFVPADAGRHVFPVTLNTLGPQTVTATDMVASTITGSASITVANISGAILDVRVRLGQGFTNLLLATFTDDASPVASTLGVSVDWGDGVIDSMATISGSGAYTVVGTHQYKRPPEKPMKVTVTGSPSGTLVLTGPVRMWPKTQSH